MSSLGKTICRICGKQCFSGIYLTDDSVCHEGCHDRLRNVTTRLEADVAAAEKEYEKSDSLLFRLFFPFTSKNKSGRGYNRYIAQVTARIRQLKDRLESKTQLLKGLYDYWPNYPPDWEERKDRIHERRNNVCEYCKSEWWGLHVHHIIPISDGGSHLPDNLMLLCEDCHASAHGGFDRSKRVNVKFDPNRRPKNPRRLLPVKPVSKGGRHTGARGRNPKSLIEKAINSRSYIHFSYTRKDGAKSVRSVMPENFLSIEGSQCVSGYCHLRHAKRTFKIGRMQNLRIVQQPGDCRDLN